MWEEEEEEEEEGRKKERVPNHQRRHAKWKLSWNDVRTHFMHIFARLTPICMFSRCLVTEFLHRNFIKSALLVGFAMWRWLQCVSFAIFVVGKEREREKGVNKQPPRI